MAAKATDLRRTRVLGVPVDVGSDVFAAALALRERGGGQVVTLNAEMTMAALADPELGAAVEGADLVIPDGAGVVWAVGLQGFRVRRTPGIELAHRLLEEAAAGGWRVALVGASPAVMEALLERLRQALPGLSPVFACHGYQPPEAWPGLEEQLRRANPDLVLVALGVPRQETWIQRFPGRRGGLWMGVGGSFDVWAGTKKRAPGWMGALHIEWLYRLIQEPSRWRRMLALPAFAWAVLRHGSRRPTFAAPLPTGVPGATDKTTGRV
ncbi:MAG: WecB/TagA/CpsF family glycosyltransferase [Prochlorococcaceae cyanobacterium]|jgi:N-acetylglucosaminyldiphosphoundecaprenol N-acetyl-beta-D-mannosaminyltransferase